jgi:hypothetical protein
LFYLENVFSLLINLPQEKGGQGEDFVDNLSIKHNGEKKQEE